ncbi:MAG TPA: ABC transporter permease, partial [Vicinamibacterales bacterium]
MVNVLQDLRYAVRALRKSPGFTLVAAITLALGVGASTAIFSVVNAVMLRPLPFAEPDRLVRIWESNVERGWPTFAVSHPNFLDFRAQADNFESMAAINNAGFTMTSNGEAEIVLGLQVTATFLPTLKVAPVLGRNFLDEEDRPGGNTRVVLLGDGFWRRAFGADPAVVGRTITLNSQPYTIIGVLPASYRFGANGDLLAPLAPDPARNRADHRLSVIGRVADGVSIDQARTQLETIAARLGHQFPESNKGWGIVVNSFYDWLVPDTTRRSLIVLMGAVALVLLIACVNVANLLLARAAGRGREVAVRAALGAGRARIVRQLLTESVMLFTAGGALGVLLAYLTLPALLSLTPAGYTNYQEVRIDATVLAVALAVSVLTGLLFGLAPLIHTRAKGLALSLKEGGGGKGAIGGARHHVRRLLVMTEVALAVMLVIGAGLLIRTVYNLAKVDAGFDRSRIVTFQISVPTANYPRPAQRAQLYQRLLDKLRGVAGVQAASAMSGLP